MGQAVWGGGGGGRAHTFNSSTQEEEAGKYEFEASTVYKASSRTSSVT